MNVRDRDDYGKRDFRDLASIASMRLSVQDLDPLRAKIQQHRPEAELKAAVSFRPGG